jgi:hypothetical protein
LVEGRRRFHGGVDLVVAVDAVRLGVDRDVALPSQVHVAQVAAEVFAVPRLPLGLDVRVLHDRLVARRASGLENVVVVSGTKHLRRGQFENDGYW